jgi:ATP synthase protein I
MRAGVFVVVQSEQDTAASERGQPATGAQLYRPPIMRIYLVQIVMLFLLFFVVLMLNKISAFSVLCGGLIAIVPNSYFAWWAFKYAGARSAAKVAQSFYRGEAGKFLFTTILFVAVFVSLRPLDVVALFLSYTVFIALNWILALRCIKTQ